MLTRHVDDDVPNSLQLEVLDQEICLLQSAAVWHVLAVRSVSRLGEQPLEGCEYVYMCARRGAGVEVVSESQIYKQTPNTQPHGFGWRIHCGVEVTELSTNKQHTLSLVLTRSVCMGIRDV